PPLAPHALLQPLDAAARACPDSCLRCRDRLHRPILAAAPDMVAHGSPVTAAASPGPSPHAPDPCCTPGTPPCAPCTSPPDGGPALPQPLAHPAQRVAVPVCAAAADHVVDDRPDHRLASPGLVARVDIRQVHLDARH